MTDQGPPPFGQQPPPPPYGVPVYVPQGYGQPLPPYYPAPGGWQPPTPRRRRRLLPWLAVAFAVIAAAVGLTIALLPAGGSSPSGAARAFLDAARAGSLHDIRGSLCADDLAAPGAASFSTADRLRSFTVGAVTTDSSTEAHVHVRVVPLDGRHVALSLPVVKEGPDWKVCISLMTPRNVGASAAGSGGGSRAPTVAPPTAHSAPSHTLAPMPPVTTCASDITGFETAQDFVNAAQFGDVTAAETCVRGRGVAVAAIAAMGRGHQFFRTQDNSSTGPVVHYISDRYRALVTVRKHRDGRFYVTSLALTRR